MGKHFLKEACILSAFLGLLYFLGNKELTYLFKYDDIGSIIATMGILLAVGSIFRLDLGFGKLFANACAALALIIFGYGLYEFGFIHACILFGLVLLIIAFVTFYLNRELSSACFVIGMILVLCLMPFRKLSSPTKIPESPNRVVDVQADWQINITYNHWNSEKTDHWEFSGTQIALQKEIQRLIEEEYQNRQVVKTKTYCIGLPDWYIRKYGWPNT